MFKAVFPSKQNAELNMGGGGSPTSHYSNPMHIESEVHNNGYCSAMTAFSRYTDWAIKFGSPDVLKHLVEHGRGLEKTFFSLERGGRQFYRSTAQSFCTADGGSGASTC